MLAPLGWGQGISLEEHRGGFGDITLVTETHPALRASLPVKERLLAEIGLGEQNNSGLLYEAIAHQRSPILAPGFIKSGDGLSLVSAELSSYWQWDQAAHILTVQVDSAF